MSRRRETLSQVDFSLGVVTPDAEDRQESDMVTASLREATNTIATATGQVEQRPGLMYDNTVTGTEGFEFDLGGGRLFEFMPTPTGYQVFDPTGAVETETGLVDWTAISGKHGTFDFEDIKFWTVADPDTSSLVIGSQQIPPQVLALNDDGTWSFSPFSFDGVTSASGSGAFQSVYQPYWRYYRDVTINPSALTGSGITVTASAGIWTADHVGLFLRYGGRAIEITGFTSSTVVTGDVVDELPPTFDLTVDSVSGYRVGDAVEHDTLGGQGIIAGISGMVITVFVTSGFDGFAGSGKLISSDGAATITGKAAGTPAATYLWDIQMLSSIHGYPGWGVRHRGRLYFCDFPSAPNAYAVSSAGVLNNFLIGSNDADGFVETIGSDRGGSLKYIVSAQDLLFLTSRGLYYQTTRDGSIVSPSTIGPTPFTSFGVASVRPLAVDDGVVFVDAVGEQIYAAILVGDVYRSWAVQPISRWASHLIDGPTAIGGTVFGAERPEQFIYVLNTGGDMAVCQWERGSNRISWRPWETHGQFLSIYQSMGRVRAIVDRTFIGVCRERFEYGAFVDCASSLEVSVAPVGASGVDHLGGLTAFPVHLDGQYPAVYFGGWDCGDLLVNPSGNVLDADGNLFDFFFSNNRFQGFAQIGLPFVVEVGPWSRRSIQSQRGEREVKREIEIYVTVRNSGKFTINGEVFGGYKVDERLDRPPPLRTEEYRTAVFGGNAFDQNQIRKDRPGPLMISKIRYRVVV